MNILNLITLTIAETIIGLGILHLFKISLQGTQRYTLALITGMGIVSFVPFILEMLHIPLKPVYIFSTIGLLTISFAFISYKQIIKIRFRLPSIHMYEWPFLLLIMLIMSYTLLRGLYVPIFPRDMLAGPEPIAQFALTEYTFANSVFEQDHYLNNNIFKSLYIPSLQLIDKLIGFEYGKIWIVLLSCSFTLFMLSTLRKKTHPIIASFLILLIMFASEYHAYMYLILYDFSNMVYYFLSLYFLHSYLKSERNPHLYFSVLLISIATYVRPETLIITGFIIGAVVSYSIIQKKHFSLAIKTISLLVGAAIIYFFSSHIYLNEYLPVKYDVGNVVNSNIADITPLFTRLKNMTFHLIFSGTGVRAYGYIFFITFTLLIAELAVYKKVSNENKFWLSMFILTFFSIAFIGYLLPLADLLHTTKRALLKLLPVAAIYLSGNRISQYLSQKLHTFQHQPKTAKTSRKVTRKKRQLAN